MPGNITKKGFDYRKDLLKAVKDDVEHPINNGIHMQAHHLISEEGVKLSKMGPLLKSRGYDINVIKNLAFIPSSLPGACHLGVQPHRGDHTYSDDEHPRSYHLYVMDRLLKLESSVSDCNANEQVQPLLNKQSKKTLSKIGAFKLPLTLAHYSFSSENPLGCGNCIDIKEHEKNASPCESSRNHYNEDHPMFKSGKGMQRITTKKHAFRLRVGK